MNVDRRAWRALFAAQLGWMLDAMDFLLFTFAIIPIQKEFLAKSSTMGLLTSVALFAAAISALVLDRFGWRVLFLIGALPAVAAFIIRRGVEEPAVWRERTERTTRFGEMFGPPFGKITLIATIVASSVLVAYW